MAVESSDDASILPELAPKNPTAISTELAFVKLRYKDVDSDKSQLINYSVVEQDLLQKEIWPPSLVPSPTSLPYVVSEYMRKRAYVMMEPIKGTGEE